MRARHCTERGNETCGKDRGIRCTSLPSIRNTGVPVSRQCNIFLSGEACPPIDKAYQLVDKLREGKNIALITDAGTPGISDPGEDLVRICYEEGIEVTSLPGPAACITALTMSGLPTRRFAFEAFCRG